MEKCNAYRCHGGTVEIWEHQSDVLKCPMRFSIFLPAQAMTKKVPLITFLSGLTCTHENFTTKANAYKKAAALGIAILAPDTSPRGDDIPNNEAYDLGQGAGFYINATQEPWIKNFQMEDYIMCELRDLVNNNFAVEADNQSIMGHSMGGHGALTLFFKYPHLFKTVSAFSPIVAPAQVPWGEKAFTAYIGANTQEWLNHDACALVGKNPQKDASILIDQGTSDNFLDEQLKPHLFEAACETAGQPVSVRMQEGYDHSYYFIQSFIDDHLDHHAEALLK